MERTSRTSSASPFSLRSTTTTLLGSKRRMALMKLEPMLPAPPMTQTFLPLISWVRVSLFASISGANILTGRNVTLSAMNLSILNILSCFLFLFSHYSVHIDSAETTAIVYFLAPCYSIQDELREKKISGEHQRTRDD